MKKKAKINLKTAVKCTGCKKFKTRNHGFYFEDTNTFTCFQCVERYLDDIERSQSEFEAFKSQIFELASDHSKAFWQQSNESVIQALERYLLHQFQKGLTAGQVLEILETK
jgi:hypothetical protein